MDYKDAAIDHAEKHGNEADYALASESPRAYWASVEAGRKAADKAASEQQEARKLANPTLADIWPK